MSTEYSIAIRSYGMFQSWGTQSKSTHRSSGKEPTKSGILGLVSSAMGETRQSSEVLTRLRVLRMTVRVDQEGNYFSDFQTAGGGLLWGKPYNVLHDRYGSCPGAVIVRKEYLSEANFLVCLGGPDKELLLEVGDALLNPKRPLFLGRKNCSPSVRIYEGFYEAPPEDLVRTHPFLEGAKVPSSVRILTECVSGQKVWDVPLTFDPDSSNKHSFRYVKSVQVPTMELGVSNVSHSS